MELQFDHIGLDEQLYPFASVLPARELRIGIFNIREKWEHLLAGQDEKPVVPIPANLVPIAPFSKELIPQLNAQNPNHPALAITLNSPLDFLRNLAVSIQFDFNIILQERTSQPLHPSNQWFGDNGLFIEEGAEIQGCIINTLEGPVYIGKNALVMEGSCLRGPIAIGEGAVVKMGTKIYGATSVGPFCTVGGEIKHSILMGYSNKAHDGYLGDSILGHWCNLGAGTTNSNVKNTGGEIQLWNEAQQAYVSAGNKCGLFMGDYSRSAINSSFNTGSVVGICCNVFGTGLLPKRIPDFSWGTEGYQLDKAFRDIQNWKAFKRQQLTEMEIHQLTQIHSHSTKTQV